MNRKFSKENNLFLMDFFVGAHLNICKIVNTWKSVKFRTMVVTSSCVGMGYCFRYQLKDKQTLANNLIKELSSIDYGSEEIKNSFMSDLFKEFIRDNVDLAMSDGFDHHSMIVEAIHSIFQNVTQVGLSPELFKEITRITDDVVSCLRPFGVYLRGHEMVLVSPPTNIHNRFNKTLRVIKAIDKSISNNETFYDQSFDIFCTYLNMRTFNRDIYQWFHPGIALINHIRILHNPMHSLPAFNMNSHRGNLLAAIAFSSTYMSSAIEFHKFNPSDVRYMHSLDSIERRMFVKCLKVIDSFYTKYRQEHENPRLSILTAKIAPELDKMIEERRLKKQIFNN